MFWILFIVFVVVALTPAVRQFLHDYDQIKYKWVRITRREIQIIQNIHPSVNVRKKLMMWYGLDLYYEGFTIIIHNKGWGHYQVHAYKGPQILKTKESKRKLLDEYFQYKIKE